MDQTHMQAVLMAVQTMLHNADLDSSLDQQIRAAMSKHLAFPSVNHTSMRECWIRLVDRYDSRHTLKGVHVLQAAD